MSEPALPFPDAGPPLTVPDSWKKATLGAPIPVIRCTYIFPDTHERPGEQCKKWSLRGTVKCVKHGGQLPDVRKHAEALVESARLRLINSSDQAVDWLLDLAANDSSGAVRLKATTEILDRAGVRGGIDVDVTVDAHTDPSQVLRDKLATTRARVIDVSPSPPADVRDTVLPAANSPDEEPQP